MTELEHLLAKARFWGLLVAGGFVLLVILGMWSCPIYDIHRPILETSRAKGGAK